jgi:hypothetical protein
MIGFEPRSHSVHNGTGPVFFKTEYWKETNQNPWPDARELILEQKESKTFDSVLNVVQLMHLNWYHSVPSFWFPIAIADVITASTIHSQKVQRDVITFENCPIAFENFIVRSQTVQLKLETSATVEMLEWERSDLQKKNCFDVSSSVLSVSVSVWVTARRMRVSGTQMHEKDRQKEGVKVFVDTKLSLLTDQLRLFETEVGRFEQGARQRSLGWCKRSFHSQSRLFNTKWK